LWLTKEAVLANIFREEFNRRKKKGILGAIQGIVIFLVPSIILSFVFKQALILWIILFSLVYYYGKRLMYWLRTDFAAEFIGDITSYNDQGTKNLILQRIEENLQPFACLSGYENVSFISHSLGTVIASDFVWEKEKQGQLLSQKIFLSNFFTMGSPLPLFSLQFGGPDVFTKPIAIQDSSGRWVNIYDKGDPIANPLKPLNDAYNRAVLKDQEVHVGMFGIAHLKYWSNQRVHLIIARKLALAWLRFNNALDKGQLDRLYADYDNNVCVGIIENN